MFVRYVGVIAGCGETGRAAFGSVLVIWSEIDVVEFDVVLDVCAYWLLWTNY